MAEQVLLAKDHLAKAYEHRTDHTVRPSVPPTITEFPAPNSDELDEAARSYLETRNGADASSNSTPGDSTRREEREDEEDAEDREPDGSNDENPDDFIDPSRCDDPLRTPGSPLPDSLDAADAFDLCDFVLSPFVHVPWIPKSLNEKWAKVFNIVIQNLLDAINSEGPGRTKRIRTAARWYLGLPQIMLRDPNR
jgi:hypothetical protein